MGNRIPVFERLMRRVVMNQNGCWIFTGAKDPNGYGRIGTGGTYGTALTHRVAYESVVGPIPEGMFACHKCDEPSCCNPEHIFLGTQADNLADMKAKGRGSNQNKGRTHCHQGHEFTKENTGIDGRGNRLCRTCRAERVRAWKSANREHVNALQRARRASA